MLTLVHIWTCDRCSAQVAATSIHRKAAAEGWTYDGFDLCPDCSADDSDESEGDAPRGVALSAVERCP